MNKKLNTIIVAIVMTVLFASVSFASTWMFVDGQNGTGMWGGDGRFYTSSGSYIAGANSQVAIDGAYYRFNDNGNVITGWYDESYYEPAAAIGWKQINGTWYYFNNEGKMLKNTTTPDGYYVNSNGVWDGSSKSSSYSSSSNHYYSSNGSGSHSVTQAKNNGWLQSGNKWYYMKNGYAITGWKKVNSHWYYFDEDGVMLTDWQDIDKGYDSHTSGEHTYFFNDGSYSSAPEGAMLKSCYVDGIHINKYGIAREDD